MRRAVTLVGVGLVPDSRPRDALRVGEAKLHWHGSSAEVSSWSRPWQAFRSPVSSWFTSIKTLMTVDIDESAWSFFCRTWR